MNNFIRASKVSTTAFVAECRWLCLLDYDWKLDKHEYLLSPQPLIYPSFWHDCWTILPSPLYRNRELYTGWWILRRASTDVRFTNRTRNQPRLPREISQITVRCANSFRDKFNVARYHAYKTIFFVLETINYWRLNELNCLNSYQGQSKSLPDSKLVYAILTRARRPRNVNEWTGYKFYAEILLYYYHDTRSWNWYKLVSYIHRCMQSALMRDKETPSCRIADLILS